MRAFRTITFVGAVGAAVLAFAGSGIAQDLIPERRLVLTENTDLPGGDLQAIFDTTLEACQRACLTNPSCTAFTFNTLKGACFPKSDPGTATPFNDALSGFVLTAEAAAEARAKTRLAELSFVQSWEMPLVVQQAETLANAHLTGPYSAEEHFQSAFDAEAMGDPIAASRFLGAGLNLTDAANDWAE
jgi:hypothetical protein